MSSLEDLFHVSRPLKSGGEVVVVDTGALIDPENQAMIMARFSRFVGGSRTLIAQMFDRDAGKFMRENYQVGYGHKSIGELGDAALCIDGVSMLCAKAIQDFPLYRGQESSTRYIDFSKQTFLTPVKYPQDAKARKIVEDWRSFYLEGLEIMKAILPKRFLQKPGEKDGEYKKAIHAAAFDIMRAFLPAGALTNVAWVGDLRHINDHLLTLRNHPLEEVREVAEAIESGLAEKFPNSFDPHKRYPKTERYVREVMLHEHHHPKECPEFALDRDTLDYELLASGRNTAILHLRPPHAELPFSIRECGTLRFLFLLDFGSFRDLQRQRAVITRMPLLTGYFDFEKWYLEQLPKGLRERAVVLIAEQARAIHDLNVDMFERQYYWPMGMRCPIRTTGDLKGLVYLTELRTSHFVHPTLRRRSFQIAEVLMQKCGSYGITCYLDEEPNRFDVARGRHDIVEKA